MTRQTLDEQLWAQRVPMLRLAMSILRNPHNAEDAVSAAIVQAYRKADGLRSEDRFKPWVMRITANCCYDLLRREKRERSFQPEETYALFSLPEDSLFEQVMELPMEFSQVLILYYYENFSTLEIAQALRIAPPTVRMRLTRGRRLLRRILEEADDEIL